MAARRKTRRQELGFYPFLVSDTDCCEAEGCNTPEDATKFAMSLMRDIGADEIIIYQAIKVVKSEPVEVEVTGVSF